MITRLDDMRALEDVVFKDDAAPTTPPILAETELSQRYKGLRFWTVKDEDRRDLLNGMWPWHVGCCYVAWQTFEGAASGIAAYRQWKGRIWRDPLRAGQQMTMAEAETVLRNALQAGSFKAEAMYGDDVVEIPTSEWPRLNFERNAHNEVIEFDRLQRQGKPRYEELVLRRIDVMKLWKSLDGWAPDFDAVVDIDPRDVRVVSDPVALIANTSVGAEVSAKRAADASIRQDAINAIAANLPPGWTWHKTSKGQPTKHPFWRELEDQHGSEFPRAEARVAWENHYQHKPGAGRQRKTLPDKPTE